ncbi:hypothetical protein [Nonomuraea jabiensis]|uniref:hypothetical protein n=1 Tax=Nonomuraea jabiensis TaxID=882448 RepID=UPI003D733578
MPQVPMCSAWNRILAEPPDSDIYGRLAKAFPAAVRWHAWPVHAVLEGWLAYAEAALTPADLADLLGEEAEPTLDGLRQKVEASSLPLELVEGPAVRRPEYPVGTYTIRLGRREPLKTLWPLAELADAYRRTLPGPLADRQVSGLEFYQHHPAAHFAENPDELAMAEWAVLGLITGDSAGHVAKEVVSTTYFIDTHALRHAFVL